MNSILNQVNNRILEKLLIYLKKKKKKNYSTGCPQLRSPTMNWKILKESYITSSLQGRCNLCFVEKISIVKYKDTSNSLNERKEFIGKCRHKNKYL